MQFYDKLTDSFVQTNFLASFKNNVVAFDIVLVSSHSTMTKQISLTCYNKQETGSILNGENKSLNEWHNRVQVFVPC